jgi:NTP pyrophosphatase (non-canonical NTP hydrolase)
MTEISLDEYQFRCEYTDQLGNDDEARKQLRFGFFGEVGGLLSAVKKSHREKPLSASRGETAEEEIGDAMWYLATIVRKEGFLFSQIGEEAIIYLRDQLGVGEAIRPMTGITFSQIGGLIEFQRSQTPPDFSALLFKLANQTGNLFSLQSAESSEARSRKNCNFYGGLLALLALVATTFKLSLMTIAAKNLQKIESRWRRTDAQYPKLFDEEMSEFERLPREFDIEFVERKVGSRISVVQRCGRVNIGDPITDNRASPDHYRYHDVFHLAYVAHLGWSPVIRGLLKLKRKSQPLVDENQDGARAMIIEEAIATWIFNHARDNGEFFEDVEVGKLEYGLLKQVHSLVAGYEVEQCPLWQWERAILDGFSVFRQLRDNGGGLVKVNMLERSLTYVAPTKTDK